TASTAAPVAAWDDVDAVDVTTKCRASAAATQPIMIGWARRIMIRLEGPAHARVPTWNNCAYCAADGQICPRLVCLLTGAAAPGSGSARPRIGLLLVLSTGPPVSKSQRPRRPLMVQATGVRIRSPMSRR